MKSVQQPKTSLLKQLPKISSEDDSADQWTGRPPKKGPRSSKSSKSIKSTKSAVNEPIVDPDFGAIAGYVIMEVTIDPREENIKRKLEQLEKKVILMKNRVKHFNSGIVDGSEFILLAGLCITEDRSDYIVATIAQKALPTLLGLVNSGRVSLFIHHGKRVYIHWSNCYSEIPG